MVLEEAGVAMAALISGLAEALVDRPDEVYVQLSRQGDCVLLSLRTAPADLGKVIGKNGRTAQALRTILTGASVKRGVRCELNILES